MSRSLCTSLMRNQTRKLVHMGLTHEQETGLDQTQFRGLYDNALSTLLSLFIYFLIERFTKDPGLLRKHLRLKPPISCAPLHLCLSFTPFSTLIANLMELENIDTLETLKT